MTDKQFRILIILFCAFLLLFILFIVFSINHDRFDYYFYNGITTILDKRTGKIRLYADGKVVEQNFKTGVFTEKTQSKIDNEVKSRRNLNLGIITTLRNLSWKIIATLFFIIIIINEIVIFKNRKDKKGKPLAPRIVLKSREERMQEAEGNAKVDKEG